MNTLQIKHEIQHDENITNWDDYPTCEIPRPTGIIRAGMWPLKRKL